jgi:hypothetical protein
METDPLERDPLVMMKRLAEAPVRLARTVAESHQLGNGRIEHGAADLKFLRPLAVRSLWPLAPAGSLTLTIKPPPPMSPRGPLAPEYLADVALQKPE